MRHCIGSENDITPPHTFTKKPWSRLALNHFPKTPPLLQNESISTVKFAARCMRVVARQHVNEIASDALLLRRARRQIFDLRRRLREAESASLPMKNLNSVSDTKQNLQPASDSKWRPRSKASSSWRNKPRLEERESGKGSDSAGSDAFVEGRRGVVPGDLREGDPEEMERGQVFGKRLSDDGTRVAREPAWTGGAGGGFGGRGRGDRGDGEVVGGVSGGVADNVTAGSSGSEQISFVHAMTEKRRGGVEQSLGARRDRDLVVRAQKRRADERSVAERSALERCAAARSAAARSATERSKAERGATERSGRAPAQFAARVIRNDSRSVLSPARFPRGARLAHPVQPLAAPAVAAAGDGDEERIATAALMERFSFREMELLHELHTWKSRCENLKDSIASRGGASRGGGQGNGGGDGTGVHVHPRHAPPLTGSNTCEEATMPGGFGFTPPSLHSPDKSHRGVEITGPPTSRGATFPMSSESGTETLDTDQSRVSRGGAGGTGVDADVRWALVLFDLPPERDGDLELRRQDIIEVGSAYA